MNITILESSPNKKGASYTLADCFIKGARQSGHSIQTLDVAHMNIHPCIGCFGGKNIGKCVIDDEMHIIEEQIKEADMVVFVTPIYFYDMSAQMKIVIDRLHCFYANLPGKKSLLLTTAWREDDEVMIYLKNLYRALTRYLRLQNLGEIMAKGCGSPETILSSRYAKEAYDLGTKI